MSDPVTKSYVILDNCPEDIRLMSIWVQAYQDIRGGLTAQQFQAAVTWFKSFIDSELEQTNETNNTV